ncbi:MAG: TolC family protein [Deltaproteobacteria bacterium]|nr:TolC family protein [Deltaproteobacteria bacterium]
MFQRFEGGRWVATMATLAAACGGWSGSARADEPAPLPWSALIGSAARAWELGPGRGAAELVRGEERAGQEVAGALEALTIQAQPEVASERSEVTVAGVFELRLGVGGARARASQARLQAARARAAAARFAFEREAIARWVSWQEAALRAEHLAHHRAAADADLGPVRAAVQARLLPELVGEGLEVELVRMDVELDAARAEAARAVSALAVWLGREVAPVSIPTAAGEAADQAFRSRWGEVLAHVDAHPELVELAAGARVVRAEALALERAEGPVLGLGARVRRESSPGQEVLWGGLDVSLRWPLTRLDASEAARLRAEALAIEAQAQVRRDRIVREIEAQAARHEALAGRLARLRAEALPRLAGRVERVRGALQVGRASLEALVMARRDALELHHEEVRLIGELVASALEGEAMLGQLGAGTDEGGGR